MDSDASTESTVSAPPPVIGPGYTFASVTDKISSIVLGRRAPWGWWVGFLISFTLVMVFLWAVGWLLIRGVGIWGINVPVAWGSPSSISCGGSASVTLERLYPPFCCSFARNGEHRSTASPRP
jgi:hypothetical protein